MQQQSNVTNGQKQNSILVLLLNWIIILGVYLLIRIVFIVLGFHLYTPLLGGLLAIIWTKRSVFYSDRTYAAGTPEISGMER